MDDVSSAGDGTIKGDGKAVYAIVPESVPLPVGEDELL